MISYTRLKASENPVEALVADIPVHDRLLKATSWEEKEQRFALTQRIIANSHALFKGKTPKENLELIKALKKQVYKK